MKKPRTYLIFRKKPHRKLWLKNNLSLIYPIKTILCGLNHKIRYVQGFFCGLTTNLWYVKPQNMVITIK